MLQEGSLVLRTYEAHGMQASEMAGADKGGAIPYVHHGKNRTMEQRVHQGISRLLPVEDVVQKDTNHTSVKEPKELTATNAMNKTDVRKCTEPKCMNHVRTMSMTG